jgi:hypothetical protein
MNAFPSLEGTNISGCQGEPCGDFHTQAKSLHVLVKRGLWIVVKDSIAG